MENLVKIQHFKEYKYSERITPEAVYEAIDKAAAEKAVAEAEERRLVAKREAYDQAEIIELEPYVDKASKLLSELEGKVAAYIETEIGIIHRHAGREEFLIAGSWSSSTIAKVFNEWDGCEDLQDFDKLELVANDIDMYYGHFADNNNAPFVVDFLDIEKHDFDDLFMELNTVKCRSLSPAGFLLNNDINVTATCFEVDLSQEKWLQIHASPRFWMFLFSSDSDRTIEVVDQYDYSKYSATTSVRIAFKHFEHQQFKLDMGDLDPTDGTLASSQKAKLDKMKSWTNNPLEAYDCKKKKNKNYYFLMAKDNELVCANFALAV